MMFRTMRSLVVVLALVVFTSACSSGPRSPTSPTSAVIPPSLALISVDLPEGATASIRVISFDAVARALTWTVIVPSGYEIWVSVHLVGPEPPTSGIYALVGGSSERGGDSGIATQIIPNEYQGIKVTKVRFMIWIAPKGERIGHPDNRVADVISDFTLP